MEGSRVRELSASRRLVAGKGVRIGGLKNRGSLKVEVGRVWVD